MGVHPVLVHTLCAKGQRLKPEAERLAEAGECITKLALLWDKNGVNLTAAQKQACFDYYQRFCALTSYIDEMRIPKRHLAIHLIDALGTNGGPRFFAHLMDESLNKVLNMCRRQLSLATFELTLLVNMNEALSNMNSQRKRYG